MEWFLLPAGYIIVGVITARWGYSVTLNSGYAKRLATYKEKYFDFDKKKAEYAEAALKIAKADMQIRDSVPAIVFGAVWWPIYLPCLAIYCLVKFSARFNVFQTKAEKEVAALKTQQALSAKRKTEWQTALRTMDEAGIDTKELRKIKID
jgi:hypothetical protein